MSEKNVNGILIEKLNELDHMYAEAAYLRGQLEAHRLLRERDLKELRELRARLFPAGLK